MQQGKIKTNNPHIAELNQDYLYHLDLVGGVKDPVTGLDGLESQFGDVKFFCCGGSQKRMAQFAQEVADSFEGTQYALPFGTAPVPIGKTDRYLTFKVGPVLICSHGIGQPSMSVLLHEIVKLLEHANATDVEFFRLGSSGGIGVPPGTVVVCTAGVNGMLEEAYSLPILGEMVHKPTGINPELVQSVLDSAKDIKDFQVVAGKTMSADCFYEGQARLDGALCNYNEEGKMEFLNKLYDIGVRNIEMEAAMFSSFVTSLGIRGTIMCVTLLNRLNGDQVTTPMEDLAAFDLRPGKVAISYIHQRLGLN